MYMYMHIYVYIYMYNMYVCVYIYIYTYIYIYIHTYRGPGEPRSLFLIVCSCLVCFLGLCIVYRLLCAIPYYMFACFLFSFVRQCWLCVGPGRP